MSFLLPEIERRRLLNNFPRQLTTSMDLVLDTTRPRVQQVTPRVQQVTPAAPVSAPKKKRCAKCPSKADKKTNAISPLCAKTTLHIIVLHVLVDNRNSLTS
ncbi:hypothetical protein RRG08_014954 [Elysia crispata]|uniref:Uncharacterized protein n=1 Tax=Elysia crispata TaxID=231223 RepID=A0AAE1E055_9GAST|nr:hypothetical protein RRG08_014954 [Elysia crispata]